MWKRSPAGLHWFQCAVLSDLRLHEGLVTERWEPLGTVGDSYKYIFSLVPAGGCGGADGSNERRASGSESRTSSVLLCGQWRDVLGRPAKKRICLPLEIFLPTMAAAPSVEEGRFPLGPRPARDNVHAGSVEEGRLCLLYTSPSPRD